MSGIGLPAFVRSGVQYGHQSLLGSFEEMTTAAIERQFATNSYGVMYVMRGVEGFQPLGTESKGGRK
jgi:hypothetical protein